MKTELASVTLCFFKKLDDGQSRKNKTVSVNFCHALFSVLDFLALEAGTNRLSWNVGMELHLCLRCIVSRKRVNLTLFGDAGLCLAPHSLVLSNPVGCSPLCCLIREFKATSHT